jgi:hypothetical protein
MLPYIGGRFIHFETATNGEMQLLERTFGNDTGNR